MSTIWMHRLSISRCSLRRISRTGIRLPAARYVMVSTGSINCASGRCGSARGIRPQSKVSIYAVADPTRAVASHAPPVSSRRTQSLRTVADDETPPKRRNTARSKVDQSDDIAKALADVVTKMTASLRFSPFFPSSIIFLFQCSHLTVVLWHRSNRCRCFRRHKRNFFTPFLPPAFHPFNQRCPKCGREFERVS